MKKLFALIALVGMGSFIAGCAEESKPPAKPATPAPGMTGPGAITPGPKAGDVGKDKGDADKDDMPADGDAKPADGDADSGAKTEGEEKPDSEDDKPSE